MATKQNEAGAMTQEQLAGVSGGPHYTNWNGIMAPIKQRRSNRTADTGRVVAIWTTGGSSGIWGTGPVSS